MFVETLMNLQGQFYYEHLVPKSKISSAPYLVEGDGGSKNTIEYIGIIV